nr:hypothetical protein [Amanita phalloides]
MINLSDYDIFMSFTYLLINNKKSIFNNYSIYSNLSSKVIRNINSKSNGPTTIEEEKWKIILGKKGPMQYAHQLAIKHINSNKPVTYKIINEILAYCNISITEEILNSLIKVPSIVIKDLDKKESKNLIIDNIGTPSSKIQIPGVYIFKHKKTGEKYVGSSSQLALRLNRHLNYISKPTGKFLPVLYKDKKTKFNLEIIPLVNNYKFRSEIVLEQYYLLDPSYNLNTVKVVNNPSGSNAKSLFMYNRDKTILYYSSTQQIDFIKNLNISHFTFSKHLKNGSYYLGKYLFSRELKLNAKVKDITLLELALQLEKDRKLFNKNKPLNSLSRSVLMCWAQDNNSVTTIKEEGIQEILFFSIGKCVEYLRSKDLPATQTTLVKYINTGNSYYGYIFKYV